MRKGSAEMAFNTGPFDHRQERRGEFVEACRQAPMLLEPSHQTFAWLGRCRRLSKHYEGLPESGEALIRLAMIGLKLQRLHRS